MECHYLLNFICCDKLENNFLNVRVTRTRAVVVALGSGCGSVGRAVASDTRGPRFESSHRQNLLNICLLSTVLKRRK